MAWDVRTQKGPDPLLQVLSGADDPGASEAAGAAPSGDISAGILGGIENAERSLLGEEQTAYRPGLGQRIYPMEMAQLAALRNRAY